MTAERTAARRHARRSRSRTRLLEPAPRSLRLIDQLGLWGNLGVSLLGFTGAIFVLVPLAGHRTVARRSTALRCRASARCSARWAWPRRASRAHAPAHRRWCCCAACSAPAVVPADRAQRRAAGRAGRRSSWSRSARAMHQLAGDDTALGVHPGRRRAHDGARAAPAGVDPGAAQVRHRRGASSRSPTCSSSCCAIRCPRSGTDRGTGSGSPSTRSSGSRCRGCRSRRTTRGTPARRGRPSPARSPGTRSPRSPATRSVWSPSSRWPTTIRTRSSARSWRCRSAPWRSR